MQEKKYTVLKNYSQPAFLICVTLLAVAAAGMSVAVNKFEMYLKKEPLPLRKSLELFDEEKLMPFKVIRKHKIKNKEIVESLGTQDYLQWTIEDPAKPKGNSTRRVMLFITYYSLPDRVPHVPEECYTGGGYQKTLSQEVIFKTVENGTSRNIPGRYLLFDKIKTAAMLRSRRFPVLYLFRVNGIYVNSREGARITLNKNIFGKTSYFCKIELVFNQYLSAPSKEQAVKLTQEILSKVLPELEQQHWPIWKEK